MKTRNFFLLSLILLVLISESISVKIKKILKKNKEISEQQQHLPVLYLLQPEQPNQQSELVQDIVKEMQKNNQEIEPEKVQQILELIQKQKQGFSQPIQEYLSKQQKKQQNQQNQKQLDESDIKKIITLVSERVSPDACKCDCDEEFNRLQNMIQQGVLQKMKQEGQTLPPTLVKEIKGELTTTPSQVGEMIENVMKEEITDDSAEIEKISEFLVPQITKALEDQCICPCTIKLGDVDNMKQEIEQLKEENQKDNDRNEQIINQLTQAMKEVVGQEVNEKDIEQMIRSTIKVFGVPGSDNVGDFMVSFKVGNEDKLGPNFETQIPLMTESLEQILPFSVNNRCQRIDELQAKVDYIFDYIVRKEKEQRQQQLLLQPILEEILE